jgi:S1/P1 Nuclease
MTISGGLGILAFALLAWSVGAPEALAWGDLGHRVICEIALRRVEPSTQAAIRKLIATDPEFTSFPDSCTWPDHPRKRAEEHFLNLPRSSRGLATDGCAGAPACVVSAIRKDAAVLKSRTASQADKLASLKYLGHWVGDVHQPLHVSFRDDRGGNNIHVTGGCGTNLHSAWDGCLVQRAIGENVEGAALSLLKSLSPQQERTWLHSDLKDWANESFAIAERQATGYCQMVGSTCEPNPAGLRIDTAYVARNIPVVREQLLKAGVRLAHLLDTALGESEN